MAFSPVIKLGVRLPRADAFSLNQSALGAMISPSPAVAEQEAQAHWLFGSDYDNGTTWPDLLSQQGMTKTGAVTINSNSISFGVGSNFLTSAIPDSTEQTICAVIQQQALPASGHGALIIGSDSGTLGSAIYLTFPVGTSAGYWAYSRGFSPVNQALPLPGATGNYIFVSASHALQVGPVPPTRTVFTSGGFTTTAAGTKSPNVANVQLGSTQISDSGALVACELIVFNKHLTALQLAAVRARSVTRMAARGITVV